METDTLAFWALSFTTGLGIAFLGALVGLFIFSYPRLLWHELENWIHWLNLIPTRGQIDNETVADLSFRAWSEHLDRRQGFWTLFVQFLLSLLVVVLITILLLMRIIEADAGLPILAALGGAAIGQGASAARTISGYPRPERRPPEAE